MNVDRQEPDISRRQDGAQVPSPAYPSIICARSMNHDPASASPANHIKEGNSRREYRWSKLARALVRTNIKASGAELSALVTQLVEESGYPRWACWRFVRRMGIRSKRPQQGWTESEQQRLQKLIDLHPINEIAKILRRSQSSVWHMLYRLGASAAMGRDGFTKNTLAVALHISPVQIEAWISRGWLKARKVETGKIKRTIIAAADFCEFCKQHTKDVVGNRLSKERLEFVYHFAFPPSHAELLPVRESKKEQAAYEAQMKEDELDDASAGFGPKRAGDDGDALDRIA